MKWWGWVLIAGGVFWLLGKDPRTDDSKAIAVAIDWYAKQMSLGPELGFTPIFQGAVRKVWLGDDNQWYWWVDVTVKDHPEIPALPIIVRRNGGFVVDLNKTLDAWAPGAWTGPQL